MKVYKIKQEDFVNWTESPTLHTGKLSVTTEWGNECERNLYVYPLNIHILNLKIIDRKWLLLAAGNQVLLL